MSVFVDTSAWYALANSGDSSHERAVTLLHQFSRGLITSDHVLVETWLLMSSRHSHDSADTLIERIRRGIARVEPVGLSDLEVAIGICKNFPDQDFSVVDRTSWAVMERLGIHEAIAFDVDFFIYRFGPGRRQAFTVHS